MSVLKLISRRSLALFPSLRRFFSRSFARAPLFEHPERANFPPKTNFHQRPLLGKSYFPIQNLTFV